MKRIIFGVVILIVFCFGANDKSFAQCSCEPKLSVQEHFQRSDSVFIGKVVEAKKVERENNDNYDVVIRFEVTQTWKQNSERFVIVKELYGNTNVFEPNAEWLVYAFKDNDGTLQITRNCCSRTKLLSVAIKQGDLRVFKKMGEKPKRIIDSKDDSTSMRITKHLKKIIIS